MMKKDQIKVQPLCDSATKEQGILRRTGISAVLNGFSSNGGSSSTYTATGTVTQVPCGTAPAGTSGYIKN